MKENIIKLVQKLLNSSFRYSELLALTNKQKDLLISPNVIDKLEECEYNALWDMLIELENIFAYGNKPGFSMAAEISVLRIFDSKYKERLTYKNGTRV